jgi:hypothetical protein
METRRRRAFWMLLAGFALFTCGLVLAPTVPQTALLMEISPLLVVAGAVLAVRRVVCPRCGRPLYMVALDLSYCPLCGSGLPPAGQSDEPPDAPDRPYP